MPDLIPFFIILIAGLLFSHIFNRLHLPWVVALIVSGIVIGPFGLNIFTPNPAIELLSEIGLIFLMFMAGLETKFSNLKDLKENTGLLLILNSIIPLAVGIYIGLFFGFNLTTALLIGIIFVSSSIAIVIPSLERNNLLKTKIGKTIITTVVLEDIISLVLLSILLQYTTPSANLPLFLFYPLIIFLLIATKKFIPKIKNKFSFNNGDIFESELRQIVGLLIGVVVIFELLGLHPIVSGFFAGIILSDTIKSDLIKNKLHAISYGIFIPIFFITIGTTANLGLLFGSENIMFLTITMIISFIFIKFITAFISGLTKKFNKQESLFIGVATTPQLSTALAVLIAGTELNLLTNELSASIVTLIITTSLFGPILMNKIAKKI